MTVNGPHVIRLEFTSRFDMLEFVQVVSDHVSRAAGLDDDSQHWVSVALRECVINAITHGNQRDETKHVFVEFETDEDAEVPAVKIRVRDQGEGFDPDLVASPLEPENLLKPGGRGIFLIRSFMDDVQLHRRPEGGMEICMTRRAPAGAPPSDPVQG